MATIRQAAVLATPSTINQCFILLAQPPAVVFELEFPLGWPGCHRSDRAQAHSQGRSPSPAAANEGNQPFEFARGCVLPANT